jgi:hypothetical protein
VSLTKRKSEAQAQVSIGLDRARQAATRVTPVARNVGATAAQSMQDARDRTLDAVPRVTQSVQKAREKAVPRVTQGVQDAREWTAPKVAQGVLSARVWAAPRIEQAAQTLQETVAPKVSGALTATAQRIEPPAAAVKRRRWPRLLAGLALVSALGGIAAAIARRRNAQLTDDIMMEEEGLTEDGQAPDAARSGDPLLIEAEVGANGKGPVS